GSDARGRVVAAQPGEVDWLAAATRAALDDATGEGAARSDSATAGGTLTTKPHRASPAGPRARARTSDARGLDRSPARIASEQRVTAEERGAVDRVGGERVAEERQGGRVALDEPGPRALVVAARPTAEVG